MASLLSLEAAHALAGIDQKNSSDFSAWSDVCGTQNWQNLQDAMASFNANSAPEDLLGAEGLIVANQSGLPQKSA